jgi:hypothetical protein
MLPPSYLLRNLLRRRTRSLVTLFGIAAVTLLVVAMIAFALEPTVALASAIDQEPWPEEPDESRGSTKKRQQG